MLKKILNILLGLVVLFNLGSFTASAKDEVIELPEVSTLSGLNGTVYDVDYSSDSRFIVAGDSETQISVFNANTGEMITQWSAGDNYKSGIQQVMYSPDDSKIVSTHVDAEIKLWDVETGKLLSTLSAYEPEDPDRYAINDIAFNKDGTILYSANKNRKSVIFWDIASGQKINELTFSSEPFSLAFNPEDQHLAIGLEDGSLNIRNSETGDYIKTITGLIYNYSYKTSIDELRYSPQYDYLFAINYNHSIQPSVVDVKNNYQSVTLEEESYRIANGGYYWEDMSFSSDNKYLAVSSYQRGLSIFESKTGKLIANNEFASSDKPISISDDNQRIVVGKTIFDASVLPVKVLQEINIKTESTVMGMNKSQSISIVGEYSDGTEEVIDSKLIDWTSTNPSVANIKYGQLYSYGVGEATISVSYGGLQDSIDIKVQDYLEFEKEFDVPGNKTWEVKFSINVDISTIKEKNIYITDETGNIVPIFYYVDKGAETIIKLIPVKDYVSGETYTLWVKEIKSGSGQSLNQYTKMEFEFK